MPYIKHERRMELHNGEVPQNPGELNFLISFLFAEYLNEHGLTYQTINDIMGAVEGAKFELYRRVAADFEETKIAQNGDVYE